MARKKAKKTQPKTDFQKRAEKMGKALDKASLANEVIIRPILIFPTPKRTLFQRFVTYLMTLSKAKLEFRFIDVKGQER